ncbi:hypothetical protein ILUMI_21686 [Ignelater luminosus]|uniref:Uncharacterized protein n=1 Tax=Ignelater luminosus TaxID=2038154 RepID=A0A8K0FXS6_IGNLU|nr:hypothetical protein ILUMI_21686 [Ignelater luminosus]
MPRYYKRIKYREFNPDDTRQAIIDVLDNNKSVRNGISPEIESALEVYLLKWSAMFYELTPKLVRRLAYDSSKSSENEITTTPKSGKTERKIFVTLEAIKPFPKAPARKEENKTGRKWGRCMIATDSPQKLLLEEKKKTIKENKTFAKKKEQVKRRCFQKESSDNENKEIVYHDHSSDDSLCFESDEERSATDVPRQRL